MSVDGFADECGLCGARDADVDVVAFFVVAGGEDDSFVLRGASHEVGSRAFGEAFDEDFESLADVALVAFGRESVL